MGILVLNLQLDNSCRCSRVRTC